MIVTNDVSVGIQDGVVNESAFMFLYEKVIACFTSHSFYQC